MSDSQNATQATQNEATATKPQPALSDSLKFVQYAARRYTKAAIDDRFGEYGKQANGLLLEVSAYAKLGSIFGWIEGLRMIGRVQEAEKLAGDIVARQLDFLAQYSGHVPDSYKVPATLVRLYDDGTFGGFSFCAYYALNWTELSDEQRAHHTASGKLLTDEKGQFVRRDDYRAGKMYYYRFSFNGGLLYHGPCGDEVFAVTFGKSDCLWSIHT